MPVLALVLATFFWGSSFITVGSALEYTNPLTLVMLRFGVAAFFVLLMLKGRIADIPKRTWKAGAACAFLIYLGYTTNAAGLMTLQSSESGFLTALYVPITPLLVWVVFGKAPTKGAVFGVMMAFAGLVLLANPFTLSFSNNWGEWVTILSALISAVEIMVVGRVAPGTQARQLAFTQLFFTAVFAAVGLAVATAAGVPLKETTFNTTVVGGILSDAAETLLAGAGVLRGGIGIFGTLGVLAICAYPFLHLGIQYLLYRGAGFLAEAAGGGPLPKLIGGLGSAFALVLGMTASCAAVIIVAIAAAMGAAGL